MESEVFGHLTDKSNLWPMNRLSTLLFFLLILLFLAFASSYGQGVKERIISGQLRDAHGTPIPGVNIVIKGTTTGTTTDGEGRYSIRVPLGATLLFSFIGYTAREVVVTEENSTSLSADSVRTVPATVIPAMKVKDGVAILSEETPSYKFRTNDFSLARNNSGVSPYHITRIRLRKSADGTVYYEVLEQRPSNYQRKMSLQWSSTMAIEMPNKLPVLQNTFAQGRPEEGELEWRGPDQYEIFSWGPAIAGLEYDASSYLFDKGGRLVPKGTGSGVPARYYDPYNFFSNGYLSLHELSLDIPVQQYAVIVLSSERKKQTGIIPGSGFERTSVRLGVRELQLFNFLEAESFLSVTKSGGDILSRGANLGTVIGSVFQTPPTFDNANGFSPRQAIKTDEAFLISDGTQRSFSPGNIDNPYWLVNNLPDREDVDRVNSSLKFTSRHFNNFHFTTAVNSDYQRNHIIHGMPVGSASYPNGRYTDRKETLRSINYAFTPSYFVNFYEAGSLNVNLTHTFVHTASALDRWDGAGFQVADYGDVSKSDVYNRTALSLSRSSHELLFNVTYEYNEWLKFRYAGNHYFSNTLSQRDFSNLLPSATLRLTSPWRWSQTLGFLHKLSGYATYSKGLRESSLIHSDNAYNSILQSPETYTRYYESAEIFFKKGLLPEIVHQFETGAKIVLFNSSTSVNVSLFRNSTDNMIVPVSRGGAFELANGASVINRGVDLSASYYNHRNLVKWNVDLKWSRVRPVVDELYTGDFLPLAGFNQAMTALRKGDPVGAVYGSTYRRNEKGQLIIGDDGFPQVDNSLTLIANPNPDWMLGCSGEISWRTMRFSFVVDMRKGGEIWNGTRNVLDYLGRSETSQSLRSVTEYVFDGVTINGTENTIPIDFANSSAPVEQNRWVRYGWSGVGEDAIESGSAVRLSEIRLSFEFARLFPRGVLKDVQVSLFARNLLLYTQYSGVDPSTSLFGYRSGAGLDLFNIPSAKNYGVQLVIKM